jgi:hypothetical protein
LPHIAGGWEFRRATKNTWGHKLLSGDRRPVAAFPVLRGKFIEVLASSQVDHATTPHLPTHNLPPMSRILAAGAGSLLVILVVNAQFLR